MPFDSQVLFPYDEFVKYFQCEVFDLTPRGLLNCGNRYCIIANVLLGFEHRNGSV